MSSSSASRWYVRAWGKHPLRRILPVCKERQELCIRSFLPMFIPLKDGEPITLNGAIHFLSTILKCVASSAEEADLVALFMNVKGGHTIRLALAELSHPQPLTPIQCDNVTAAGISNGTIKKQRSCSMEMQYFYVCDQVKHK